MTRFSAVVSALLPWKALSGMTPDQQERKLVWQIFPSQAVTCVGSVHVCADGFVRNTTKDATECAAAACIDDECCQEDKKDSGAFPSAPLAGMLVALCLHVGSAFA